MAQSMAPPAAAARGAAAGDVWAQLRTRVEARLRQFEEAPPTPAAVYALEQELRAAFDAAGRAPGAAPAAALASGTVGAIPNGLSVRGPASAGPASARERAPEGSAVNEGGRPSVPGAVREA